MAVGAVSYEAARAELRAAELALMQQREAVAELRRGLPLGPPVADYEFVGPDGPVRLSDLSTGPGRPLVLYHFMYGMGFDDPCPMCSMWVDGWAGVADHLVENLDFVVVSSASFSDTTSLADDRGWSGLRWVSAAESSFKLEIGGETPEGHLMPFISVYEITGDGPRLSYSGGAHIEGDHWRGVDLLSPVWHLLDLTRPGRHDWMPSLANT